MFLLRAINAVILSVVLAVEQCYWNSVIKVIGGITMFLAVEVSLLHVKVKSSLQESHRIYLLLVKGINQHRIFQYGIGNQF